MDYPSPIRGQDPLLDDHPLTDYWNVLVRRWRVVLAFLIAGTVGGVLYFRSLPVAPFPFTTVIEIGSSETPEAAQAKIEGAYAPQALAEHASKQGYQEKRFAVTVALTAKSSLLALNSLGSESSLPELFGIQQRIIDLLLADHRAQEDILRSNLRSQKFRAELDLEGSLQAEKFFPARLRRFDERAALLKEKIAQAEDFLGDLEQKRAALLASEVQKTANQEPAVSTFFIIDGDIQRQREKKRAFEEELNVTLRQDREKVEQGQLDNKRRQKEQQKLVDDVQLQIESLKTTKVLLPPQRQLRSSARQPTDIVGAAAILGALFGMLSAFFVEFAANARKAAMVK